MYLINHTFHTGPGLSSLLLFNPSQSHLNPKVHGYSFTGITSLYALFYYRYCMLLQCSLVYYIDNINKTPKMSFNCEV